MMRGRWEASDKQGTRVAPLRTFWIYVGATFMITWPSWWGLALLVRKTYTSYGHPLFMALYLCGGLGPTITAYAVVLHSDRMRDFHARVFKWRIAVGWYLAAVAIPVLTNLLALAVSHLSVKTAMARLTLPTWYAFLASLPIMVFGGGLEELGWRGIALPQLQRKVSLPVAAGIVGVIWSAWHLPLFFLPGVTQYRMRFSWFALETIGLALVLAWFYARTGSILICVVLHAAFNSAAAAGLKVPTTQVASVGLEGVTWLILGILLIHAVPREVEPVQPAL